MFQTRLNDAAIVLGEALSSADITYGFFGGYAVNVLGGQRECKDIDCLASGTCDQITKALLRYDCFRVIPQARQDLIAMLWTEKSPADEAVGRCLPLSIKIFVDNFPGFRYSMSGLALSRLEIRGQTRGRRSIAIVDPVLVFKGKLNACANRDLPSDAKDLRVLAVQYGPRITERSDEFVPGKVMLATARHKHLQPILTGLGLKTQRSSRVVPQLCSAEKAGPAKGEVQQALLQPSRRGSVPANMIPSTSIVFRTPLWSMCES